MRLGLKAVCNLQGVARPGDFYPLPSISRCCSLCLAVEDCWQGALQRRGKDQNGAAELNRVFLEH